MRTSDRAWLALAAGVTAYDLIATDDEQLSDAAHRYFRTQPAITASIIRLTGLHLIGGIPAWCDPFTLSFNGYRRLLVRSVSADLTLWVRTDDMSVSLISGSPIGDGLALAHDGSCCGS